VSAADGTALALQLWPAAAPRRGSIVLVHGLGEHVGRYAHVASHLTQAGWDLFGYDQRGHGRSAGARGAVPREDALVEDLREVLRVVREQRAAHGDRSGPLLLLGHSMGGQVAATFVARAPAAVDALILTSPALDAELSLLQRWQLAIGRALVPDVAMGNQLDATKISHDPAVVHAYRTDPLVHDRITARLAATILAGGREVRAAAAQWRVPTLLLWAGDDHLVAARGSAAFAAAAPRSVVTAQCFDGLYHELLNERDATPVFAALDAWLARFPTV